MVDRRHVLFLGAAGGLAPLLAGQAASPSVTRDTIAACERFAGTAFSPSERTQMLAAVDEQLDRLRQLRNIQLPNDLAPAEIFDPRLPGWKRRQTLAPPARPLTAPRMPRDAESIAFAPAWQQQAWLSAGTIRSRDLVDIYLERIAQLASPLECFVEVLADSARAEANAADRARAKGQTRGPLHGLPYGLKDLIDAKGTLTTWGAEPWKERRATSDATIVTRLREAGAVLLAKTTCGAIAYGDIWHGGRTRNPWNPEEGSSGSSAGSAAAVSAGLCSFAIGTETMGSIMAPAERCGTVGLRPTFGRIPRSGAMALCWSLDKIGALARSTEDMLPILQVLNGPDVQDPACYAEPLEPQPAIEPTNIRLGFRPEWFEGDASVAYARNALEAARAAGFILVPIEMPATPTDLLSAIILVESAAAFEQLTLDNMDDQLAWQDHTAWPNTWRATRFEPAVGYVQAQRLRRRLMQEFANTMANVDAILYPNGAPELLGIGNHTGYPALTLPCGLLEQPTRVGFERYVAVTAERPPEKHFRVPFNVSLIGHLFDEPRLLAMGAALAKTLDLNELRPPRWS